jgi:hypothetical protein
MLKQLSGCRNKWSRTALRAVPNATPTERPRRAPANALEGYPKHREGRGACAERVAIDGHPGLARSTDCAAQ